MRRQLSGRDLIGEFDTSHVLVEIQSAFDRLVRSEPAQGSLYLASPVYVPEPRTAHDEDDVDRWTRRERPPYLTDGGVRQHDDELVGPGQRSASARQLRSL